MSTSNPNKRRGYHHGNLRTALLTEARLLIRERGTHAVTLRDLGERLGVSRTAPYRHFRDRKALLGAVAEQSALTLTAALNAVRSGDGNVLSRLRRMGRAYLQFAEEDPSGYRLIFHEPELLHEPDPALKAAVDAAFGELSAMVAEAQQAGVLKREETALLATHIWSVIHGLAALLIDGRLHPETDREALFELTEKMLFEGVGRRSFATLLQRFGE